MGLVHNMVWGPSGPLSTGVFGVEWDGSSTTRLTRTDDAASFSDPIPAIGTGNGSSPFDNILPWAGMERVTDSEAGELVKIPKFWYKLTQTGDKLKIQITNEQTEGFYCSPAHVDRDDGKGERDFVYIGRYHCNDNNWKSQTGGLPKVNITKSAAHIGTHNLGSTIWQIDFPMRMTLWLLYIVEFADWDSQTKIGYGCGNNSSLQNMGYTDSMMYHTGTTQVDRTTYGCGTQYRWIEGLWDNCYDWLGGCYNDGLYLYVILKPSNFLNETVGTPIRVTSGWISAWNVYEFGGCQWLVAYHMTDNGSNSTYVPDYWDRSSDKPSVAVGGCYNNQTQESGLFQVTCFTNLTQASINGARVMKLP